MKAKRRRHDPEFKARVAIEAIKNIRTTAQIAKDFDVHPAQVSDWKKQMLENAVESFSSGRKKTTEEEISVEKERAFMPKLDSRLLRSIFCEKSQNSSVYKGPYRVVRK